MKNVTIKDIAKAAGVKHPTVSKALNGRPGVNEETRRLIVDTAKKMHYVPNIAARRLANRQKRTIGFLWPLAEGLFFYHLCNTLQKYTLENQIDLLASLSGEEDALRTFNEHMIDFVLCWFFPDWTPRAAFQEELRKFNGNLLIMGGGKTEGAHTLEIDRTAGIYTAIDHLLALGHRNIAFLGERGTKHNAYLEKMEREGLPSPARRSVLSLPVPPHDRIERRDTMEASFRRLWESDDRPTAAILCSQGTAFDMLRVFHRLNIQIPRDLSVVSYDDIPELSVYDVPLTTVAPPIDKTIEEVLDIYETVFRSPPAEPIRRSILPALTIRESTRPLSNIK